jgi:hypothetical protein
MTTVSWERLTGGLCEASLDSTGIAGDSALSSSRAARFDHELAWPPPAAESPLESGTLQQDPQQFSAAAGRVQPTGPPPARCSRHPAPRRVLLALFRHMARHGRGVARCPSGKMAGVAFMRWSTCPISNGRRRFRCRSGGTAPIRLLPLLHSQPARSPVPLVQAAVALRPSMAGHELMASLDLPSRSRCASTWSSLC